MRSRARRSPTIVYRPSTRTFYIREQSGATRSFAAGVADLARVLDPSVEEMIERIADLDYV